MASIKLNTTLRLQILEHAIRGAFADEFAALEAEFGALYERIYEKLVPKDQQELAAQLPKGFCHQASSACVRLKHNAQHLGDDIDVLLNEARFFPAYVMYNRACLIDGELSAAYSRLYNEKIRLENAKEDLKRRIRQVLHSVTTVAKLLEAWPECKEFIPEEAFLEAEKKLPAVIIGDLNSVLEKALGKPLTATAA